MGCKESNQTKKTNIMWPMYLQSLKLLRPTVKEMHLQENIIWPWPQVRSRGSRSHKMLPSTLYIMCVAYASAKFDVATSHG